MVSTDYCYGVVLYKASHGLQPLFDLLCVNVKSGTVFVSCSALTFLCQLKG
jgi:hypothetical protein